jgi:antirestriction protein ArdC
MSTPYEKQAQELADFFIAGLQDGTAKWVKPWSGGAIESSPYNPTTGKAYRGGNTLTLEIQQMRMAMKGADPDDARWMTYRQADAIGAQVRKGEKATALVTLVERGNGKKEAPSPSDELSSKRLVCLPFAVFHASQIDGLPALPKVQERPMDERVAQAAELVKASGAVVREGGDRAYYSVTRDYIGVPHRENFTDDGLWASTILHELGHWSGHETRLDRKFGGFGSPDYAKEELRAEMASYSMCQRLGVPFDPSQHVGYVNHWIKTLQEDPKEIMRAAADAEKILTFLNVPQREYEILPKIEKTLEREPEKERTREVAMSR